MLPFPLLQGNSPGLAEPAQAHFENISKVGIEGQFQMHCFGLGSVVDHVYVFMETNVYIAVANDAYGGGRKDVCAPCRNVKTGHGMIEQACPDGIRVLSLYR
jgi:hypothetical protein